jgi:hypothetical protein
MRPPRAPKRVRSLWRLFPFRGVVAVLLVAIAATVGVLVWPMGQKTLGPAPPIYLKPSVPPQVEMVADSVLDYLRLAEIEGGIFKYSGCFLECWLDLEADGKVTEIGPRVGSASLRPASWPEGELLPADANAGQVLLIPIVRDGSITCDLFVTAGLPTKDFQPELILKQKGLKVPSVKSADPPPDGEGKPQIPYVSSRMKHAYLQPGRDFCLLELVVGDVPAADGGKDKQTLRLKCRILAQEGPTKGK